jgi:hypothetical protein
VTTRQVVDSANLWTERSIDGKRVDAHAAPRPARSCRAAAGSLVPAAMALHHDEPLLVGVGDPEFVGAVK